MEVWRDRGLRELAFVSMVYAAVQLCVLTYLISYFKIELGYTLVRHDLNLRETTAG